ncbi:MAG TPA: hypothetical protein VHX40_07470 [Acidimicrobiales bacterium]|nr:hypothetical protein [Acidimicrobiales bacterium]
MLTLLVVGSAAVGMGGVGSSTPPAGAATPDTYTYGQGLVMVGNKGGVYTFGKDQFYGSEAGHSLTKPIVAAASTSDQAGYWLVGGDSGIFAFGDAHFHGNLYQINPTLPPGGSNSATLPYPIVGMAATGDSGGYWMVGSQGAIYAFGDAWFYGSAGQINPTLPPGGSNSFVPTAPIVGMALSRDGGGYWLVGSDGAVYAFGDANYYGGENGHHLNQPIVAISPEANGNGYWLVGGDGGIFSFGSAQAYGTPVPTHLPYPIVGLASTADSGGFWLVSHDGGIAEYGDAYYLGAESSQTITTTIVGLASATPTDWPPIPPGVNEIGLPAVGADPTGRLEVFARGSNCQIYHAWQTTTGAFGPFTGWAPTGACPSTAPIVARDPNGALQVFIRTTTGQLWHSWQTSPAGGWTGWYPLSANGSSYHLEAVTEPDGRVDVYFDGNNGCIWHLWETTAGTPNSFSGSYQVGSACGVTSDPIPVLQPNGQVVVFFRGGNGQVWQAHDTAANQFGTWLGPYPTGLSVEVNSNVSAVQNAGGKLTIFGTGTNSQVWWEQEAGVNNAGTFGSAYPLSGANEPSGQSPVAGANQNGHMEVFFAATSGVLWHSIESGPSTNSYVGPYPLTLAEPSGQYPAVILDNDGRLVVVAHGAQFTRPWINAEVNPNTSGNYSSWQLVG